MKLSGWTWLIFGGIIAIFSGYIYLFIPRNGSPNTAMALFFFIGVVFAIIGTVKIFFKKSDDAIFNAAVQKPISETSLNSSSAVSSNIAGAASGTTQSNNRIEQAINGLAQQQSVHSNSGNSASASAQHILNQSKHTNSYAKIHQYKGPVHTSSSNYASHVQPNAGHNTHYAHASTQHASAHQAQGASHAAAATSHGVRCGKCSNVNAGHSNYCHQCGHRLK